MENCTDSTVLEMLASPTITKICAPMVRYSKYDYDEYLDIYNCYCMIVILNLYTQNATVLLSTARRFKYSMGMAINQLLLDGHQCGNIFDNFICDI